MPNALVWGKSEDRDQQDKQLFIGSWMPTIPARALGDFKSSKNYEKHPHPCAHIFLYGTCFDSVERCTKQTVDKVEISVKVKNKENSCH